MSSRYGEPRLPTAGLRPAPAGMGPHGTLYRGRDGKQEKPDIWNPHPSHKTAADLFHTQHLSRLPDPTYDVDGDGVVSTEDLYMASKFDCNGDGILDQDELISLRRKMVNDVLQDYTEQPFAASGPSAQQVNAIVDSYKKSMGADDETATAAVLDENFPKKFNILQQQLFTQSGQSSNQMYQSLMARPIESKFDPKQQEFDFGEQLAFDKNAGFKPRS